LLPFVPLVCLEFHSLNFQNQNLAKNVEIPTPLFQSECFSTRRQTSRNWRARSSLVLAGKFFPFYYRLTPAKFKLRGSVLLVKPLFNSSLGNTTLLQSDR
ncbi:hypothetical protein ACROYT_G001030, partial [Oculina patagonica]